MDADSLTGVGSKRVTPPIEGMPDLSTRSGLAAVHVPFKLLGRSDQ